MSASVLRHDCVVIGSGGYHNIICTHEQISSSSVRRPQRHDTTALESAALLGDDCEGMLKYTANFHFKLFSSTCIGRILLLSLSPSR